MTRLTAPLWIASALGLLLAGCSGGKQESAAPTASEAPPAPNLARSTPDAGKVEHVSVRADGRGPTATAAVDQAIKLAIQQVNGKTMDMSALQFQAGMAVSVGEEHLDIGSSGFAEFVATQSRGAVTGFKLLSQRVLENGDTEVAIEAQVAKYARPDSAGMLRVVVMPFRSDADSFVIDTRRIDADSVAGQIRGALTDTLVKTRRVTVLDREFAAEVQSEIDLLATGRMSTDDFARLGEQLMADYVVVGHIDRFGYERHERQLRTSDRTLVSHSGGAAVSFRVINATTGQIELSDTASVDLPSTAPTTLGTSVNVDAIAARLLDQLSAQTSGAVVMRLFPLTVVAVEGDTVVLSQGGSMVSVGDRYDVVLRGKEITDPQTGRVIGRVESPCCTVEVTRVTPEMSYARVLQSAVDVGQVFAPGALEVSGPATAAAATVAADTPAAERSVQATPAPQVGAAVAGRADAEVATPGDAKPAAADDPNW